MSASRVPKKVFIVGGGWMGVYLAQALEKSSRADARKNEPRQSQNDGRPVAFGGVA